MPKGMSVNDRFWEKVHKTKHCWLWVAGNKQGYGVFLDSKRFWGAHRYAWTILVGDIPKNKIVCHKCDAPACVNPEHLFLGTYQDNAQDCLKKGRASRPPDNSEKQRFKFSEEVIKLFGTMPDYKIAEIAKTNKSTVAKRRRRLGIKSYAEQTGNNGQFKGIGLHPCWKTPLRKKLPQPAERGESPAEFKGRS